MRFRDCTLPSEAAVGTSRAPRTVSVIAIDGPAASGKSAVGAALAAELGFHFFDTGALYRALTWLALKRGIDPADAAALARLALAAKISPSEGAPGGHEPTRVLLDGDDATSHLRDLDVDRAVSLVSRVPGVRAALMRIQRELAAPGSVVMAGRDIGSVVLPDADLKVYLDAPLAVRAQRRLDQAQGASQQQDLQAMIEDLKRRDHLDSSRAASPLTAAPGAVIINTAGMPLEEVVQRIVALAHE